MAVAPHGRSLFERRILRPSIERRGWLHAFGRLEPARCALVVSDMQNAFVQEGAGHAWVPAAPAIYPTQAEHDATLAAFLLHFGDVQTVDEVIADLGRGPGPG